MATLAKGLVRDLLKEAIEKKDWNIVQKALDEVTPHTTFFIKREFKSEQAADNFERRVQPYVDYDNGDVFSTIDVCPDMGIGCVYIVEAELVYNKVNRRKFGRYEDSTTSCY